MADNNMIQTIEVVFADGRTWKGSGPAVGDLDGAVVTEVKWQEPRPLPRGGRWTTVDAGEETP